LFIDNLFGSKKLARELSSNDIAYVMAIKTNSDISRIIQLLKEVPLDKAEWTSTIEEIRDVNNPNLTHSICILRFNDKKDIFFISNCEDAFPTFQNYRYVPQLVNMYNQSMNFIDKIDSVTKTNEHKSDWSTQLFRYTFRLVLNNCWRYWQVSNSLKCSMKEFISALICDYLARLGKKVEIKHFLEGKQEQHICANCSTSTTQICVGCRIHLHTDCFKVYHDKIFQQKMFFESTNIYNKTKKRKLNK